MAKAGEAIGAGRRVAGLAMIATLFSALGVVGGLALAGVPEPFIQPVVPNQLINPGGPAVGKAPPDWQPPARLQGDIFTGVMFGGRAVIRANCDRGSAACTTSGLGRIPLIVAPNPCGVAERYALMLCHEIGHANGWAANHAGGHFVPNVRVWSVRLDLRKPDGVTGRWAVSEVAANARQAIVKAQHRVSGIGSGWRVARAEAY